MSGLPAQPWWVNLLVFVPPAAYLAWRGGRVPMSPRMVISSGLFAAGFGFVEAVVVVYLRAAVGLLPGFQGTLSDVMRRSGEFYDLSSVVRIPESLLTLELLREACTMIMLVSVAFLASASSKVKAAVFLWTFAVWDIVYYATLWATIRWPLSLRDPDVLFLIPVPWFSPVWFPLLVSALAIAAVLMTRQTPASSQ